MTNPENISKQVEETLASLDHIERATANPFLYTRIIASLKSDGAKDWSWAARFLSRPVIALAAVVVVIIMNAVVVFQSSETSQLLPEEEQIFASEYNYPQTTADRFYSVNDEQP
ncbi:MAG: hypothetical protein H7Y31_00485 [Chitinophagaceae bacterium]|nr:hypothetical protein [Chitinophagaceae bacterium]